MYDSHGSIHTPCFKIRLVLKLNCFKIEINFNFRFEDCGNEFYYLIKVFILKDNYKLLITNKLHICKV